MAGRGDLARYRAKRDFSATPEPASRGAGAPDGPPRFVVQRHDARALHYDLRVEVDGVLASFAVPKGLPLRAGVKRLAVRTEDHPLEYLTFSGVIPAGQYGAGRMDVWDSGTYEAELMAEGEWKLVLHGGRVDGHYHLVRTGSERGREQWLLFRSGTGPPGPPDPVPAFRALRPMLAQTREEPFDDPDWAFELKWDGYRALTLVTSDLTELRSRTGRDLTPAYPDLADLRRSVIAQEVVLDGEICVLDPDGRPSFHGLQSGRRPVTLAAFDLLHVDGEWLMERPWRERRARLAEVVPAGAGGPLLHSDHVDGAGRAVFAAAGRRDVEGIVAKRRSSPYLPGRRSPDWVKVKHRTDVEVVIGGFTPGQGGRRGTLGAVLVGVPSAEGLAFAGQVGSGLDEAGLRSLRARLDPLVIDTSPFTTTPEVRGGPAAWVRPELRCIVRFVEWTPDRRLRAPVFAGLVEEDRGGARARPAPVIDRSRPDAVVAVGDREVRLTNLGKPYWPGEGITKGDLLDHYARVAGVLVPHLAGRPQILKRWPDGIEAQPFFQHQMPRPAPSWLSRVTLTKTESSREEITYAVVDDPASLLWVANLGCVDLNPWCSLAHAPNEPTHALFDLDPAEGVGFDAVVEVALMVAEELDRLGLRGWPKTSGSRGIHILVPVGPGLSHDVTRLFATAVGERLAERRPDLVTMSRRVADRGARVYADPGQNGRGKSVASVWSVRPRARAPVSTPLRWDEVRPGLDPRELDLSEAARRVAADEDPFASLLTSPQPLRQAAERLVSPG